MLNSTEGRAFHSKNAACPICHPSPGVRVLAAHEMTEDAPKPLHNPFDKDNHWYHGTVAMDPDQHEFKTHDEMQDKNYHIGGHWNTSLGTHFSSLHHVADDSFAKTWEDRGGKAKHVYIPGSRIAHVSLHMQNPAHFEAEKDMDRHAEQWAADNGYAESYETPANQVIRRTHKTSNFLSHHPDRAAITEGYKKHLQSQGHDGITYGNDIEGPIGHLCAIAFKETPVTIHKWDWKHKSEQHKNAAFTPHERVFGPTYGLDHRLFDGEKLRPEIRANLLRTFSQFCLVNGFKEWSKWAEVEFWGSEASEWTSPNLEGNGDFDTQIAIDYDSFRRSNPQYSSLSNEMIAQGFTEKLKVLNNPQKKFPGVEGTYDQTWYCNLEAANLARIKPYAAYSASRDVWLVKPPHLPNWSLHDLPRAIQTVLRAADSYARRTLALPEPDRTREAATLYDMWHLDRGKAFSDEGQGWVDIANLREKWLDQAGLWKQLYEAHSRYSTKVAKVPSPTHAGLCIKAADTGRILMIQRSNKDEKDPARGTWEFPGGKIEPEDKSSLHAAMREWHEEVGQRVPEGGYLAHVWRSGPYVGHVMVIPNEEMIDFSNGRSTINPDDPDGDDHEQSAWWEPQHAKKNPALRQECKSGPWGDITKASAYDDGPEKKPGEGWPYDYGGGSKGELPVGWVDINHVRMYRQHKGDQQPNSPERVEKLAEHLRNGGGLHNPLQLEYHAPTHTMTLGEGNHRLEAAHQAGWSHVPVSVWPVSSNTRNFMPAPGEHKFKTMGEVKELRDRHNPSVHPKHFFPESAILGLNKEGSLDDEFSVDPRENGIRHQIGAQELFRPSTMDKSDPLKQDGLCINHAKEHFAKNPNSVYTYHGRGHCLQCGIEQGNAKSLYLRPRNVEGDFTKEFEFSDQKVRARSPFSEQDSFVKDKARPFVPLRQSLNSSRLERAYGSNDLSKLFPVDEDGPALSTTTPWPRTFTGTGHKEVIARSITHPHEFEVKGYDPRSLHATQPSILHSGVKHYFHGESGLYGQKNNNDNRLGNDIPRVLEHEGKNILLSGHHRAAAALLRGEPLQAISIPSVRPTGSPAE